MAAIDSTADIGLIFNIFVLADPFPPFLNAVTFSHKQTLEDCFGLLYPKSVACGSISRKNVRNLLNYIGLFIVQGKKPSKFYQP